MSRIQKLENIYKEQLTSKHIKDTSAFFQFILDADITKGKYARFLIEAFLNDKFLEEDLIGGLNSTVGQAISLFDKHKGKLPENMRSVYALNPETGEALYQSPGDLWNSVKQYQDELSGKELKKEEQEQVYRETEFIYKDEETGFQIISPLTKESAKWWGKGTRWCTSAENNNMFEHYAKKAPLFILLMPTNEDSTGNRDKLQLWNCSNSIQFMDEVDNSVTLEYIEQNWDILEPVCLWLNNLKYIPDIYMTEDICKNIIQKHGAFLYSIPKEFKTLEICELAIANNGSSLQHISEEYRTQGLCEIAVKQDGLALYHVPDEFKTKELCELAVNNNGNAIVDVPLKLMTEELCKIAVKQNGHALHYIPEKFITKELCEIAVQQYGEALKFIQKELRTKELCELAIQQNGLALRWIPMELRTEELYELAVKQNGDALCYVPESLRTEELCEIAIQNNGEALRFIPIKYRNKELCEIAVQQNGLNLIYVPYEIKTEELCKIAVKQNQDAFIHVPEKLKNKLKHYIKETLFELPLDKYHETFQEIKTFFPKKDIFLQYNHV
jgi:hypothetical protein